MIRILCALFFVSGASALLFETLWFRQASLTFGSSVWASSLVLAGFMAGLALGNGLAAHYGARVGRPLACYAGLEVAVASAGALLVWALPGLTSSLAAASSPFLDQPWILNPVRLGSGFALLVVPSTAMGATLPLLVKRLAKIDAVFGSALGRLYGWNTLGAVLGALAGEAFLIEWFGVRGAALTAACGSLGAAIVAAVLSLRFERGPDLPPPTPATGPDTTAIRRARRPLAAAFLCGASLLALEVVWFRFLHLFVHSEALAFSVMLAVVLAGIGLGGAGAGAWLRRDAAGWRRIPVLALSTGALVIALYAGFSSVVSLFRGGTLTLPSSITLVSLYLMFPISLLSGVLFTFIGSAVHEHTPDEARAVGLLTLANTLGAALGSLVAGFVLLPILGIERSFFLLAAGYGIVAALLAGIGVARPLWRLALPLLYVAALVLFPFGRMEQVYLPLSISPWNPGGREKIVAVREGRIHTSVVLQSHLDGEPTSHRLVTDSFSMAANSVLQRRYMQLFVYWPVALHPHLKSALLISFGVGSTASALADTKSLEQIDVVDTSRDIVDLSRVIYETDHPLDDPRVHVHIEDGRYFLEATRDRYDLITGEPPPPKNAGVVSLYTREYFQRVRGRLNEGGMATYWLPVHQLREPDAKSIIRAFCDAFPDCSLWTGFGLDWMLVGSRDARFGRSEAHFALQWKDPVVAPELRALGFEVPAQLGATFLMDAADLDALTAGVLPLTDDHPKRLSSGGYDTARAWATFGPWLDTDTARARFADSAFVRRAWPERLRRETLAHFEYQRIINALAAPSPLRQADWRRNLHQVIATGPLESLALWLMGTNDDELLALDRLESRGRPIRKHVHRRAVQALARRDFDLASRLFAQARLQFPNDRSLLYFQLYALRMAGRFTEAKALTRGATWESRLARSEWRWMNEYLDGGR